jgi:hypothetical protein
MYVFLVVALMSVLPVASIVVELMGGGRGELKAAVAGRWFVFWGVGVRLFLAGLRQISQPRYTAEIILGIKSTDSLTVVRELGFATTAIGFIGVGSLFASTWVLPAAILENVAMASDLFIAVVLLAYLQCYERCGPVGRRHESMRA